MANIVTDALTNALTYDVTGEIIAADKRIHRDLVTRCNCAYPASLDSSPPVPAVAEVQDISAGDRTGGTFELDFDLGDSQTFSAVAIAFNATAGAIETAIDTAANGTVTGWTDGDIAVTGGPVGAGGATVTLTFSGASVLGKDAVLTVVDGANLTGGTTDPVASDVTDGAPTVPGTPARFWFAALKLMGVIEGTDPAFGAAPAGQYTVNLLDTLANYPSVRTVQALIKEATKQEGQDWIGELYPLLNYKLPDTTVRP